jgi:hypothetical protein
MFPSIIRDSKRLPREINEAAFKLLTAFDEVSDIQVQNLATYSKSGAMTSRK